MGRARSSAGALAMVALAAGCSAGDGGGGGDPPPDPVLSVDPVFTISGTNVIERGECVGFVLELEGLEVEAPAVRFGYYELDPFFFEVVDPRTIEVGQPCFFTGLDLPLGALGVGVVEDGRTAVASGAFEVVETTRLELGEAPASSADLEHADANVLGAPRDFDVYEWEAASSGLFLAEVVVSTGADPSFLPYSFVAPRNLGRWWNGHELVLVPAEAGEYLVQVSDHALGGGAEGFRYEMRIEPVATPAAAGAAESCDSGAAAFGDGVWSVDLAGASDDLDPGGAFTCADRHTPVPVREHEGVTAPGGDRVLRLVVGSGATLAVAARGATTDVVIYLLPDDGDGCSGSVDPCLAAADTFGASDTETLLWTNDGPDRSVFLVVDDFGGTDSVAGPVDVLVRGALPAE